MRAEGTAAPGPGGHTGFAGGSEGDAAVVRGEHVYPAEYAEGGVLAAAYRAFCAGQYALLPLYQPDSAVRGFTGAPADRLLCQGAAHETGARRGAERRGADRDRQAYYLYGTAGVGCGERTQSGADSANAQRAGRAGYGCDCIGADEFRRVCAVHQVRHRGDDRAGGFGAG